MRIKFRIYHLVILFSVFIILIRIDKIVSGYLFILSFLSSLIDLGDNLLGLIDFATIDIITSSILIFIIPIFVFFKGKKIGALKKKTSFIGVFLIAILFIFIFSPLVANINPNFSKDLITTKLLPPLSSVRIIHLKKSPDGQDDMKYAKLKSMKNEIAPESFNEFIIIADSVRINGIVTYFQKGTRKEIDSSLCEREGDNIKISSFMFLLGSDEYGRDIFSRLIYSSRVSILVALGSLFIISGLGIGLGFAAGINGGYINQVLTRFSELFLYFPSIFLAILIFALFGNSILTLIIVLGITGWTSLFKIVKSEVVAIRTKDFIISSRKMRLPKKRLLISEILPFIAPSILVTLILQFANIILAESSLSFLGLGAGESYPSWGAMIHSGQEYLSHAWWMLIFPGGILVALLFSINELGERVKIFLNPRMRKND
jgi:peptide/nickel transport system permease protein